MLSITWTKKKSTSPCLKPLPTSFSWTWAKVSNQGVIVCYQTLAKEERGGLPRRYQKPLEKFNERKYLIITQAYKGGGVVVKNNNFYVEKMLHFLSNGGT